MGQMGADLARVEGSGGKQGWTKATPPGVCCHFSLLSELLSVS